MGTLLNRVAGLGPGARAPARAQFKQAVIRWMRTGQETYQGESLADLGRKAWHSELNTGGGYLLAPERRSPLDAMLAEISPMRSLAEIKVLSGDELEIPINKKGTQAGWVGERESRPETSTPELALNKYALMELYAMPAATQRLLDNVDIDVEAWLYSEIVEAFALQESEAFITGDGLKKPKGLLDYDLELTHANWAHGKFRGVKTGASGAFPASFPGDKLIDLVYALKGAYRPNARWLFTRNTAAEIRKFKDSTGQYLWKEGLAAGQPPTLLNYEISEDEWMPEIGADTVSVGFGDWQRTYLIVEKPGVRVLRDDLTQKPYVLFYTTKLVGGGVKMFDAAVFLKFSA
jgi:HK97 family phage major capsid protein